MPARLIVWQRAKDDPCSSLSIKPFSPVHLSIGYGTQMGRLSGHAIKARLYISGEEEEEEDASSKEESPGHAETTRVCGVTRRGILAQQHVDNACGTFGEL